MIQSRGSIRRQVGDSPDGPEAAFEGLLKMADPPLSRVASLDGKASRELIPAPLGHVVAASRDENPDRVGAVQFAPGKTRKDLRRPTEREPGVLADERVGDAALEVGQIRRQNVA